MVPTPRTFSFSFLLVESTSAITLLESLLMVVWLALSPCIGPGNFLVWSETKDKGLTEPLRALYGYGLTNRKKQFSHHKPNRYQMSVPLSISTFITLSDLAYMYGPWLLQLHSSVYLININKWCLIWAESSSPLPGSLYLYCSRRYWS